MDAIHNECYKDMKAKLIEREEFFGKEIVVFRKEQTTLEKKLEKLEQPPEEPKPPKVEKKAKAASKQQSKRKKTKAELKAEEEERKRQEAEEAEKKRIEEEEAERKRLEEEERKKAEEEAAKKAKGKDKGKKGKQEDEAPEEVIEETPEQKLEREKQECRDKIAEVKQRIEAYQGKIQLAKDEQVNCEAEKLRTKKTDLMAKNAADLKSLNQQEQKANASDCLTEKLCYQFVELKKAEDGDEEEPAMIKINGAACRTPAEDIKWEEEQKEAEANAPKGGKAPAKGKKK
jgi:hypothetical protein